jgi:hypothetical protein
LEDISNPTYISTYTATGEAESSEAIAIKSVDEYLYVDFDALDVSVAWGSPDNYTEIINPQVSYNPLTIQFNLVCSDHGTDPACSSNFNDLNLATNYYGAVYGNPMGDYIVGKSNDSTTVVFETTDPLNPTAIKVFESPYNQRIKYWEIYPYRIFSSWSASYSFDDSYLYLSNQRSRSNPWGEIYVFDLYSPDTGAVYVAGDMDIMRKAMGTLLSKGKYLYYFVKQHSGEPQYEWEEPRVILANTKHAERREGSQGNDEGRDAARSKAQPGLGRTINGGSHRIDRLRLLGNGVMPRVAEKAWRVLYEKMCKKANLSKLNKSK